MNVYKIRDFLSTRYVLARTPVEALDKWEGFISDLYEDAPSFRMLEAISGLEHGQEQLIE